MYEGRMLGWMTLAVLAVLAGCAAELGPPGAEDLEEGTATKSSALSGSGTVFATGGAGLNVRQSPSTTSAVVGWVAEGASVSIECQTRGDRVNLNDVWNYLPAHGGYVADSYMYTGYDSWIPGVPRCGADAGEGGGSDGCGDVDYAGYCDGETLVWCEEGRLRQVDCSERDRSCEYESASVGYNCVGGSGPGAGPSGRLTVGQLFGGAAYSLTQDYGPTTFDGGYSYCQAYGSWGGRLVHCGVDYGIGFGTALYVPEDGVVTVSGETPYFEDATNPAAGELRIRTAAGTEIILGHMSRIDLWTGQTVSAGQFAGLSGTMNGPHLHLEVRVRDSGYASGFRTVDPAVYFGL